MSRFDKLGERGARLSSQKLSIASACRLLSFPAERLTQFHDFWRDFRRANVASHILLWQP